MIVEHIRTLEVENIGDTEEGIEAGISEDSMPFVFEFVSTQLYSNPIGSLIREITSNAHDAHIEAGNEDPVIVKMYSTLDEGWFIEFIDKGVGISPERMSNIYMNYFSSTKRGSNSQIGGFGLGSKTPLAYQDYFYIDTVFDGFSYKYLYHKGESKPTLESLRGYWYDEEGVKHPKGEPTEDRNGTTIKLHIKDSFKNGSVYNYSTDLSKFKSELTKQLTYFDNVYFQGCNVSNDYDIYEGKYFKFRSDIDQFSTSIHISLGNVRYNLDTNVVKVPSEMIQVPIAIKFEIGELKVTPSRESLRYTETDILKIQERVLLLQQELSDRFELQNPVIEDLGVFIRNRSQVIKIVFDAKKRHALKLWSGSEFSKSAKYAPLKDMPIRYPKNLFFMWKIVGMLSKGEIRGTKTRHELEFSENDFLSNNYMVIEDPSHISQYTNAYIEEQLGYYGTILLVTKDRRKEAFSELGLRGIGRFMSGTLPSNKARVAYQYMKQIDKQVLAKSRGTYESYKPSKEWLVEYRRREYERTAAYQRVANQLLFVRDIGAGGYGVDVKRIDLLKSREFVIFGYREDKDTLVSLSRIIRYYYDLNRAKQKRPRHDNKRSELKIIQVSQSTLKGIQYENPNIIYCNDFYRHKFMVNLKARFVRTATIDRIYNSVKSAYLKGYRQDYERLKDTLYSSLSLSRISSYISQKELDFIPDVPGLLDDIEEFKEKYDYRLPFVHDHSITPSSVDWLHALRIIKESGVRIHNYYYLKTPQRLQYERHRNAATIVRHFGHFKKPYHCEGNNSNTT